MSATKQADGSAWKNHRVKNEAWNKVVGATPRTFKSRLSADALSEHSLSHPYLDVLGHLFIASAVFAPCCEREARGGEQWEAPRTSALARCFRACCGLGARCEVTPAALGEEPPALELLIGGRVNCAGSYNDGAVRNKQR